MTELEAWLPNNRDAITPTFRERYDDSEGCWIFEMNPLGLCPPDWGLIAGDAIHDFRATLDYLAWQIADAGTDPKPLRDPEGVQFPIFSAPSKNGTRPSKRFANCLARNLPGALQGHIDIVESFQPYKRPGGDFWRDPLALLADASNTDKHRRLRAAVLAYMQMVVVTDPADMHNFEWMRTKVDFERVPPNDCIKPETVVIRLFGRPAEDGEPQVKVTVSTEPEPTFDDTGVPIYGFFAEIGTTIAQILAEFDPIL